MTPARERYLLAAIKFVMEYGWSPTLREVGEAIGVCSTNAVQEMLRKLDREGYVRVGPQGTLRALVVLKWPDGTPFVPTAPEARKVKPAATGVLQPPIRCPVCRREHYLDRNTHADICRGSIG